MEIFTIGSSGTSGRRLVENLKSVNATALVDTRVHPNSQLAGFAKQNNLEYILELTLGIPLIYASAFCPPEDLLRDYRRKSIDWDEYSEKYLATLESRDALETIDESWGARPVLLCSEQHPRHCHRRLVAELIREKHPEVKIAHLLD